MAWSLELQQTIPQPACSFKGQFMAIEAKLETYLLSELSLLVQILGGKPALEMKSLLKMAALPTRRL